MVGTLVHKTGLTCPRPTQTRYTSSRYISARKGIFTSHIEMKNRIVFVSSTGADEGTESTSEAGAQKEVCKTCGVAKNEMAFGCDGSGRIMGGIGAVPGFGWWPIKAYRPCGKAVDAGVTYQRKGQGVDEVMFGRK